MEFLCWFSCQDFLDRGFLLTRKLLNQGFLLVKLKLSLWLFYCRHHDMVDRYGISVSQMSTDMFHFGQVRVKMTKQLFLSVTTYLDNIFSSFYVNYWIKTVSSVLKLITYNWSYLFLCFILKYWEPRSLWPYLSH